MCYAAEAVSFSAATAALMTDLGSGLSVTVAIGCQLRVCRAQRRGLAARAIEPAIMASEIERLPDLGGYLKLILLPPAREGWRSSTRGSGL